MPEHYAEKHKPPIMHLSYLCCIDGLPKFKHSLHEFYRAMLLLPRSCVYVCLSVCLSVTIQSSSKTAKYKSRKQRHTKAMDFSFLESIGAFCASVVYWNNCLEHIHTLKIIYSKINVILIIFGTSYSEDMIKYFAMQCICLPVQILALEETANR